MYVLAVVDISPKIDIESPFQQDLVFDNRAGEMRARAAVFDPVAAAVMPIAEDPHIHTPRINATSSNLANPL